MGPLRDFTFGCSFYNQNAFLNSLKVITSEITKEG